MRLEVRQRQPLQLREEVVAHVVLDVPRRADDDPAHQEAEHAADQADGEQGRAVQRQLGARHAERQVVDGVLQHPRTGERNRGRSDDAREPEEEIATVGPNVPEQTPER